MIAVVTALREELQPLLRRTAVHRVVRSGKRRYYVGMIAGTRVVLTAGGTGMIRADAVVRELLERFEVSAVIGVGLAGGLTRDVARGELLHGETVVDGMGDPIACDPRMVRAIAQLEKTRAAVLHTSRSVVTSAEAKSALGRQSGAHAVDMESAAWGRAAAAAGVPFTAIRVVVDDADESLPEIFASTVAIDGSVDRAAIARHVLVHPHLIPVLSRLRNAVRERSEELADVMVEILPEIGGPIEDPGAQSVLDALLEDTSRTFALCIPLLPSPTRLQVTISYLLFRIADTFEDASHWPVAARLEALDEFCDLLRDPSAANAESLAAKWSGQSPSPHSGYARLIAQTPLVIRSLMAMQPAAIGVIRDHVIRSAQGMREFVAMTRDTRLELQSMDQLHAYCYAVAGIVGEMLTELFLLRTSALREVATLLRDRAATFGEGLQLVNILKDAATDRSEGRSFIPRSADPRAIAALARRDLQSATGYTLALQSGKAPAGVVAFAALPVALADATLDALEAPVPQTKISRSEVFRITRHVNRAIAQGRAPVPTRAGSGSALARVRSLVSLAFGNRA